MSITVERIAKTLSISLQETIKLLEEQGIKVSNAKSVLSEEDLNRLNATIQRIKNENIQTSNDNVEERALNNLEYYFSNYKIFIDTCSLLHFASDQFWLHAVPIIQKTSNKIIVPIRAMEEIKKHSTNADKPELKNKAQGALGNLNRLISAGLLELRGEETDNFADNVFQVVFTKFRMTHKVINYTTKAEVVTIDHRIFDKSTCK